MADNDKAPVPAAATTEGAAPTPPKRSPGHRGADVKDTVAEMAAKAHEISLEAGSKMAAAMKDVVTAAAGLSGFVIESARDLVQFMVRRGQMTQEEADKLIRQVEEHQPKRKPAPPAPLSKGTHGSPNSYAPAPSHASDSAPPASHAKPAAKPAAKTPAKPAKPAPKAAVKKAAPAKKAPAKKSAPAKKPAAKKSAAKSKRK